MYPLIEEFLRNERGATSIEYALVTSGISLAIVVAIGQFGPALGARYAALASATTTSVRPDDF